MSKKHATQKAKSLFRVVYLDGAVVTTKAQTSLLAQKSAARSRPGIIMSAKIVRDGK